jgi:hypothetical protein
MVLGTMVAPEFGRALALALNFKVVVEDGK